MANSGLPSKHFLPLVMCFTVITYSISLDFDGISEYQAVVGGLVSLPCNTSFWIEDDISLVIWYRGNSGIPIYTVDARSTRLSQSKQVPSEELGGRALMDISVTPPSLKLDPVIDEDEGEYRCRVDYRKHRTQHFLVHLNVTVPPKQIIIKDTEGNTLQDMIGPYDEGDSLTLVCEVYGGKPLPSVVWLRNGVVIDDTYVTALQESTDTTIIRNELQVSKLERDQLLMEFMCHTTNSNLTNISKKASVTIDLNLKPLEVSIVSPNKPLSSGHRTEIKCHSRGSRPPAQISWWLGSKKMVIVRDSASNDGNTTISTLSFIPAIEDNGKHLSCRADNVQMANDELEDGRILTVYYLPQLTLALGANIRDTIREGSDVYFECTIVSNPWVTDVSWLFEGSPLLSDPSSGIIVSNQSLVLQKVRREHRGRYQCTAINAEGQGSSNKVFLRVYFSPVCKAGQTIIYGVARNEQVNVSCDVEAEPSDSLKFKWFLNNSMEIFEIRSVVTKGSQSNASYVPKTRLGYGTLLCWAENMIGKQKEPCAYSIVAAGPPNPVHDCYVPNVTMTTLWLECVPGDNGGLRQIFHLQVYNVGKELLHSNLTSLEMPVFFIDNLPADTAFTLNIFASNAKGRSDSQTINTATAPTPQRHARKDGLDQLEMSPIIGILIGIVASLVVVCLIAVIVIKFKVDGFDSKEETELHSKCVTGLHQKDQKESDSNSHMNLISSKTDSFGYTDIRIEGFNKSAETEYLNNYQLMNDHQSEYNNLPSVLYKCSAPDVTYAELSIVTPAVGPNHQRVIVRHSQDEERTQYAQIDFQRSHLECSPTSVCLQHRESPIPDGCSETEVTLETPLVSSAQHKFYTQEVLNPTVQQTTNNATHV